MNLRPSGYEPDELPGCSTPRQGVLLGRNERVFACFECCGHWSLRSGDCFCFWWTWRRPTLPTLGRQYHRRGRLSRPSSGWDRVVRRRHDHQVDQEQFQSSGVSGPSSRSVTDCGCVCLERGWLGMPPCFWGAIDMVRLLVSGHGGCSSLSSH